MIFVYSPLGASLNVIVAGATPVSHDAENVSFDVRLSPGPASPITRRFAMRYTIDPTVMSDVMSPGTGAFVAQCTDKPGSSIEPSVSSSPRPSCAPCAALRQAAHA